MKTLNCEEALANMSCYIDGDGSAETRAAIRRHAGRCRRCRALLETTGKMLRIVADSSPFDVPLAASARLYERLEQVLSNV